MDNSQYRAFVLQVYQAVSDPDGWQDVLDRIVDHFGAHGCLIHEWTTQGNERRLWAPMISTNYDRTRLDAYLTTYHEWEARDHDRIDVHLLSSDGIDITSEKTLYEDESEYLDRPHVKWLLNRGIRHRTGSLLDKDNPFRARFSVTLGEERGPFDDAEIALIKELLPHVAKALELARPTGVAERNNQALLAIIDRLTIGVCLLDSEGRRVLSNAEFDRQGEVHGVFRDDGHGRLALPEHADRKHFAALLTDALSHGRFGARPRKEAIVVEMPGSDSCLCIEVVPLEKSAEIGTRPFNGALVFSRDTAQPMEVDMDLVKRAFSLTAAESAVIDLVCKGMTNVEIAEQRARSVETINAQVKAILAKTRALNRTQLVRLLGNFSMPGAFLTR